MKRILITGKNSYIGTSFATFMKKHEDEYQIDMISVRDNAWKELDFSVYDVLLHCAGIAHLKETKKNQQLYYDVNYELTKDIAIKAKKEKVKKFIFLSSMSVYGLLVGEIDKSTIENPQNAYGKSKLLADNFLNSISSNDFIVQIVRPPMIYGENCKGNYQILRKIAIKSPIFPKYENKRSMIFIDNLSEFIYYLINSIYQSNVFLPQNNEYVCTSMMVSQISKEHGKFICLLPGFGWAIRLSSMTVGKIGKTTKKVFGNLYYKKSKKRLNFLSTKDSLVKIEGE